MAGESRDFGSLPSIQGPPLFGPAIIGNLSGLAYTDLLSSVDMTGYAGVWLSCGLSSADNLTLLLSWRQDVGGTLIPVDSDNLAVPSQGNLTDPNAFVGKWFPARGQNLRVAAAGNSTQNYSGFLTIVPTTAVYPEVSAGVWPAERTAPSGAPGLIGSIDAVVPANTLQEFKCNIPWWGNAMLTWDANLSSTDNIRIRSYSYKNLILTDQAVVPVGFMARPISFTLPASCYHTVGFFNTQAVGLNPHVRLIGDVS